MNVKSLVAVAVAAVLGSCSGATGVGPETPDTYDYRAYDPYGELVVSGWFVLTRTGASTVDGEWHFTCVSCRGSFGPQTGAGELNGSLGDNRLFVNLNPQYTDNNVFLDGHPAGNGYAGSWNWTGFPGVLNSGTFEATRR